LRADKNTWYENELVSANITGSIKLGGVGLAPTVTGHIESSKGSAVYIGTQFDIKYAAIDISNNHVFLEGQAESNVYSNTGNTFDDNDTIQLIIDKAEITQIKPRFASKNNPNIDPRKAMARATGINPDTTNSSDTLFYLRKSILRFVDSSLTTPLAKSLLGKSGLVDSFKVQYVNKDNVTKPQNPDNPTIADFLAGTKYSLEKYINSKLAFGYSMTLDALNNKLSLFHELGLSVNLNKGLFLKGTYDLDSDNPLHQNDRRIELQQQWRFGSFKKKPKTSPKTQ
jgi:translocation and assembly module TamB